MVPAVDSDLYDGAAAHLDPRNSRLYYSRPPLPVLPYEAAEKLSHGAAEAHRPSIGMLQDTPGIPTATWRTATIPGADSIRSPGPDSRFPSLAGRARDMVMLASAEQASMQVQDGQPGYLESDIRPEPPAVATSHENTGSKNLPDREDLTSDTQDGTGSRRARRTPRASRTGGAPALPDSSAAVSPGPASPITQRKRGHTADHSPIKKVQMMQPTQPTQNAPATRGPRTRSATNAIATH